MLRDIEQSLIVAYVQASLVLVRFCYQKYPQKVNRTFFTPQLSTLKGMELNTAVSWLDNR